MAHYRLYFLNSRTGKIERFEEFEAQDDDQALVLIEQRIGDQPLELWSGGRKIGQFETALALSGVASAGLWMRDEPHSSPPPARRLFSSFG
jgi:hypothetical protein